MRPKDNPGDQLLPSRIATSQRVVIMAALAAGATEVRGLSDCADVHTSIDAVCQLGAIADLVPGDNGLCGTIIGAIPAASDLAGDNDFDEPLAANAIDSLLKPIDIECRDSATTAWLLMGALSGYALAVRLFGGPALEKLPFGPLIRLLLAMGARINRGVMGCRTGCGVGADTLPLLVKGRSPLKARAHVLSVASTPIKDALLLAGLRAQGVTSVSEPDASPSGIVELLQCFGVKAQADGSTVSIVGPQVLQPASIDLTGDLAQGYQESE